MNKTQNNPSLCKRIFRIFFCFLVLYALLKIVSCTYYYGEIVYRTFCLTPWSLFANRENRLNYTGWANLVNFIYRIDGYVPSSWAVTLKDIILSQAECDEIHHVIQKLLLDPKHMYERFGTQPGVRLTFLEKGYQNGIRLRLILCSEGFWIDYDINGFAIGYPVTICCGPHTSETQVLWNRYGDINAYLPLSEKVRAEIRGKREYDPIQLNILNESLLETPIWEPEFGVLE